MNSGVHVASFDTHVHTYHACGGIDRVHLYAQPSEEGT